MVFGKKTSVTPEFLRCAKKPWLATFGLSDLFLPSPVSIRIGREIPGAKTQIRGVVIFFFEAWDESRLEWAKVSNQKWWGMVRWDRTGSRSQTIHVWYIYLHLVDFHGKCRWIFLPYMDTMGISSGKKKILERKPASPTCSQKGDGIFGGETLRNVGVLGILFANIACGIMRQKLLGR